MSAVLSEKYEIAIPEDLCEQAGVRPGQEFEVFCIDGVFEVVPVDDIKSARGSLPGLKADGLREEQDRI